MSLRAAEIAGVIAGVVIGALVLCTAVCYVCTRKRAAIAKLTKKSSPSFATSADHAEERFEAAHPEREAISARR